MFQSFDKLFVIAIIAVVLLGPTRLPVYASKLASLVKTVRAMADNAKERMAEEMGDDFQEVDWQKLDPRQYDPRRIIRDALLKEPTTAITTKASAAAAGAGPDAAAASAATWAEANAGAVAAGAAAGGAGAAAAVAAGLPGRGARTPIVPLAAGEVPPYDNEST